MTAFQEAPSPAPYRDHTGRVAKVGFTADKDSGVAGEWMWVEIAGWNEDGYYGRLLNEPVHIAGLSYGDEVHGFDERHIYQSEPAQVG